MNVTILMNVIVTLNITLAYASYIPQIIKLARRKSSEDVSKWSWFLWTSAAILDTWYSILLGDSGLIMYSSTELTLNFIVLGLTIRYRKKDSKELESSTEFIEEAVDNGK